MPTVDQMDREQLLTICLDWLANVNRQDRARYLDAMPNNAPGVPAMAARLAALIAQERTASEDTAIDSESSLIWRRSLDTEPREQHAGYCSPCGGSCVES